MSKKANKNNKTDKTDSIIETNKTPPTPLHEEPTTSPLKFMALFFGIPVAVLITAIVFRTLTGA